MARVALPLAVEVLTMDAVALGALQVVNLVDPENVPVCLWELSLTLKHGLPSLAELFLQSDESCHVFVVRTDVVEESDHSLTVHGSLNGSVAIVKVVLGEHVSNLIETSGVELVVAGVRQGKSLLDRLGSASEVSLSQAGAETTRRSD